MTTMLPRSSGVYQIRCVPTGKIYIGSAVDLKARWDMHRRRLRRGNHSNIHLQNAWDKYGETKFVFLVLEYANKTDLLEVEQKWIDKTGCVDKAIGFNIYDVAGSPGDTYAQIWEGFIDPDGNEIIVHYRDGDEDKTITLKSLDDIDMKVLKELITESVKYIKNKKW